MSHEPQMQTGAQTFRSYVHGLVSSLVLTLAAYTAVVYRPFSRTALIVSIIVLAILQAAAQFIYFLHLAQEEKPKWNLLTFLFMTMVVAILVFGSIWIMFNLNERVMNMGH
jgi:cytochrome o ubiquinol oxidase operon protein cyoD